MNFYQKYKWLAPSIIFSVSLIAIRIIWTREITFIFINWNLFLAVLPLFFSYKARESSRTIFFLAWSAVWLLFFPNAMYITTDIFHLDEYSDVPRWFDLVLLTSAALNGMIFGLISLYNIEIRLRKLVSSRVLTIVIFALLVLCGYGIYLGRYLRWNSWDIIAAPLSLCRDVTGHLIHPFRNANIWILSLVFGTWMLILYNFVKRLRKGSFK
jgi:uncharacterized membrane protein